MRDIGGIWEQIKTHRKNLNDKEMQGIADVLLRGQEDWLGGKLRQREDEALVLEFLGCMGRKGSVKAIEILLQQLEAREEVLQAATAEALKRSQPLLALEPLAQMMLRQSQSSIKAGEVLLSFGDEGVHALWELWFGENKPSSLKAQILHLLAEAKDDRSESLVFLGLLSKEEELIRAALIAADKMETKSLWRNVAGCLKNSSWQLRSRAIQLLSQWEEKRALPYLRDMEADADPWVEEERQKAITLLSEDEEAKAE